MSEGVVQIQRATQGEDMNLGEYTDSRTAHREHPERTSKNENEASPDRDGRHIARRPHRQRGRQIRAAASSRT